MRDADVVTSHSSGSRVTAASVYQPVSLTPPCAVLPAPTCLGAWGLCSLASLWSSCSLPPASLQLCALPAQQNAAAGLLGRSASPAVRPYRAPHHDSDTQELRTVM